MHRRHFLGMSLIGALGCWLSPMAAIAEAAQAEPKRRSGESRSKRSKRQASKQERSPKRSSPPHAKSTQRVKEQEPDLVQSGLQPEPLPDNISEEVRDYLIKMRSHDAPFSGDLILSAEKKRLLDAVTNRLERLQAQIGHGHFYLIGMDEAIRQSRRPSVGTFPREELDFLEELFHTDASAYGFLDSKPLRSFTSGIRKEQVIKVSGMGNYIYKGAALEKWNEIRKIVGDDVLLTSGIRGMVKQFHLFLAKAQRNGGNLSLASRSLAPPGYSFHAVGDFDVGQRGFGVSNFTSAFTTTPVYQKLSERGYITLRYPRDNFLGVRFEPWHVKVLS